MILTLVAAAWAGEPTLKGSKFVVDGEPVLAVKTYDTDGSATTVARQGVQVVVFELLPYTPRQQILGAEFRSLGKNFSWVVPETTPADVLVGWWNAGVLTAHGAELGALGKWCAERNIPLNDTAEDGARWAEYAATHPAPPACCSYTLDDKSASRTPRLTHPPPAEGPTVVPVSLHISCGQNVRLFFGLFPNGGGTYGWESPNSSRSALMEPGSVVCICDESDHVQSCWIAGASAARLDVGCGGFMQQ